MLNLVTLYTHSASPTAVHSAYLHYRHSVVIHKWDRSEGAELFDVTARLLVVALEVF